MLQRSTIYAFRRKILHHYRKYGRSLPWRNTHDPYHILVSEVMLQQTQVARVIPYYSNFINTYPTILELARATTQDVLRIWSGLGYNSRAIRLLACARKVASNYGGVIPSETDELQKLPGIGAYTSGAIAAFAFDKPVVFYDTNIRRVLIAGLQLAPDIEHAELEKVLAAVLPKSSSREWYNALMDYGAMKLTASKTKIPPLSKQSIFKGSDREVRGRLMKILLKDGSITLEKLSQLFPKKECSEIVRRMIEEGLPLCLSRGNIKMLNEGSALKK